MTSFGTLAVIGVAALAGPLLAAPRRWSVPVVVGEVAAGLVIGHTGFGFVAASDPTLTFLADVGFALVMFVAGSHVRVRDADIRSALGVGALRAAAVGVLAVGAGWGLADWFDTGHAAVYAVVIASSSAALVLPATDSLGLSGDRVVRMLAQVAVADTACIVALPLVIDTRHAGRAAVGALTVVAAAALYYLLLRGFVHSGWSARLRRFSRRRNFALELRVDLAVLFAIASIAVATHVSIMLAGFAFGLAMAGVGVPRRLGRQLFAVTDGFLGPLFFVWLGASLDLRALGMHPSYIALGVLLGVVAALAHLAMRLFGQSWSLALLACAQVGVPVAAATIGTQTGGLRPGEPAALLLGALVTIGFGDGWRVGRRTPVPSRFFGWGADGAAALTGRERWEVVSTGEVVSTCGGCDRAQDDPVAP
ncbi:MAG: cation:proton antiporter [Actinobacteria bacterium]|nr:cation:proton antiporter [Actinomycetota bacterium]